MWLKRRPGNRNLASTEWKSDINGKEWCGQFPKKHGKENGAGISSAGKQLSGPEVFSSRRTPKVERDR